MMGDQIFFVKNTCDTRAKKVVNLSPTPKEIRDDVIGEFQAVLQK